MAIGGSFNGTFVSVGGSWNLIAFNDLHVCLGEFIDRDYRLSTRQPSLRDGFMADPGSRSMNETNEPYIIIVCVVFYVWYIARMPVCYTDSNDRTLSMLTHLNVTPLVRDILPSTKSHYALVRNI